MATGVALLLASSTLSAQQPVPGEGDSVQPYTVAPQLLNSTEIAQMLENQYPPDLRDRGITGTTVLLVYVNADGGVRRASVWESSGESEFDRVATTVASSMKFRPARSNTGPIAVSITVPVEFKLKQDAAGRPEFIAYDVKPRLLNSAEADRVLAVLYPPDLKRSRTGGQTMLWIYIGVEGYVRDVRVMESSGYEEFDRAANLSSRVMEFSPALADGEPVAVWDQITVTFLPGGGSTVRP